MGIERRNFCKLNANHSIYLGYHTLNQVMAGSLAGIVFGLVWYTTVKLVYAYGVIDAILDLRVSKMLYLKDMTFVNNVAKYEYEQWVRLKNNKSKTH